MASFHLRRPTRSAFRRTDAGAVALAAILAVPLIAAPSMDAGGLCRGPLAAPDVAACLFVLVVAPVLEEWVVRAGVQAWCLRGRDTTGVRARLSVVAAGLFFAALHLPRGLASALLVLPVGVSIGLLYLKTRRWTDCALAHGACNAGALFLCGASPL